MHRLFLLVSQVDWSFLLFDGSLKEEVNLMNEGNVIGKLL